MHAHQTGSGPVSSTIDAYELCWLVIKLVMNGDPTNDDAYMWINPDPAAEPDTAVADVYAHWEGSRGWDRIRIGSGDVPNQCECYYDEIRIARTFEKLLSDMPMPLSVFDFEEGEGVFVNDSGPADIVAMKPEEEMAAPALFALQPNYPNPFNPTTTLRYTLERNGYVSLAIYDLLGREIKRLVNGPQAAGHHRAVWDGTDMNKAPMTSGVYIYQLISGGRCETRKMMLLK